MTSKSTPYTIDDLIRLTEEDQIEPILETLSKEQIRVFAEELAQKKRLARQVDQLSYYQPVSPRVLQIHLATEKEVLVAGGNRSTKTDSILADTVICMTGVIPFCMLEENPNRIAIYPKEKILCPMRVRLVCESLTNTWEPVIKPKLQWDQWNGRGAPGGEFGHWGWIPRRFLFKGQWDESWSVQNRTLTLTCGCTMRIMSYDQDIGDFGGVSLHRVIHDEPPPNDIYRENFMRTIDTGGQLYSGFTPSDNPGRALRGSWIYDVYERGLDGPGKDPDVKSLVLYTEENKILDPAEIEKVKKGLTAVEQEVRFRGGFMHLTGKIYPTYTDVPRTWCFQCNGITIASKSDRVGNCCATCGGNQITKYNNFIEPDPQWYKNPIVFVLDPHPRKGHMMCWISVNVFDDACLIAHKEIDASPEVVRDLIFPFEENLHLSITARLIDPKMAGQSARRDGRRHVTYRESFDDVGIRCKIANSDFETGKDKVIDLLKPDPRTFRSRFTMFNTCHLANRQMKNYIWDEWVNDSRNTKDPKPTPIEKGDDYPTMIKYFANENFTYSSMMMAGHIIRGTREERSSAYG